MTSKIELSSIKFALNVLHQAMSDPRIDERGVLQEMIRNFASGDSRGREEMIAVIAEHVSVGMELESSLSP